jgi:formate dehydrogenase iron-sulfur subunit
MAERRGEITMSKALLYDATVCIGCKQCEVACAEKNKLRYDDAVAAEQTQSEHKFTVVLTKQDKFMRRLCMNCSDPACASVCPVGAPAQDGCWPGDLRGKPLHGVPLLHGRLSVRGAQV